MRSFDRLRAHPSLLIMAIVVLLTAHGMVFYLSRHLALSAAFASGLVVLIIFKHLGLSVLAMFRKRSIWREPRDPNPRPPA